MSFSNFGLSPTLLRAVEAAGYTDATPIQTQAIPHVLTGRDVLGCAQTGTGKTAAFALPLLNRFSQPSSGGNPRRPIRALVLSPTRELALQIGESFREYGRHCNATVAEVYGGVNQSRQVQQLRRGVDIVVATPGRLCDLIGQRLIRLDQVDVLVLDEADRMLDMGFLPDVKFIIDQLPTDRQTVLFSATMPSEIEKLANSIMFEPIRVQVAARNTAAERISQSVYFVAKENKVKLLADLLQKPEVSRTIVFSRTKHGADRIVRQLEKFDVTAAALHGDKSQNARQRILADFRSERTRVLVATDIAARGIDVDGITHIFNFDLPMEPETYVHRIGRTARAGAEGVAISFCTPDERRLLREIEGLLKKPITVEQHATIKLAATPRSDQHQSNGTSSTSNSGADHRQRTLSGKYKFRRTYASSGRRRNRKVDRFSPRTTVSR